MKVFHHNSVVVFLCSLVGTLVWAGLTLNEFNLKTPSQNIVTHVQGRIFPLFYCILWYFQFYSFSTFYWSYIGIG